MQKLKREVPRYLWKRGSHVTASFASPNIHLCTPICRIPKF